MAGFEWLGPCDQFASPNQAPNSAKWDEQANRRREVGIGECTVVQSGAEVTLEVAQGRVSLMEST
jgi:hypothetical protein